MANAYGNQAMWPQSSYPVPGHDSYRPTSYGNSYGMPTTNHGAVQQSNSQNPAYGFPSFSQASAGGFKDLEAGHGSKRPPMPSSEIYMDDSLPIGIRNAFVRKVYSILAVQLLITFGIALPFTLLDTWRYWILTNYWVTWVAFLGAFIVLIVLLCIPGAARHHPTNLMWLFIFSACFGIVFAGAGASAGTEAFVIAAGATTLIVVILSLWACQTKYDFTGMGSYVLITLVVLIIFGIVGIFVRNRIYHIVFSAIGTLLFCMYLVYDTQRVVGGKNRQQQFSMDDYVPACITLYLDIINLFLFILSLTSASQN